MTAFALIHGAWHGAWCWEALTEELEQRGHTCVAPELPATDVHAGASAYADCIVRELDNVTESVVLVGHSLAGLSIPLVATKRPVCHLVFLCALLPHYGMSLREQQAAFKIMSTEFVAASDRQMRHPDGSTSWPTEVARELFFHDCPDEAAEAAVRQLRRQAVTVASETTPVRSIPNLPVAYIVADDDRVVLPAWSRKAARERLGVDAHELPGGHSPFIARPTSLADILCSITAT